MANINGERVLKGCFPWPDEVSYEFINENAATIAANLKAWGDYDHAKQWMDSERAPDAIREVAREIIEKQNAFDAYRIRQDEELQENRVKINALKKRDISRDDDDLPLLGVQAYWGYDHD